jgi:hypothetical protein
VAGDVDAAPEQQVAGRPSKVVVPWPADRKAGSASTGFVADLTLRRLLADPGDLARVRAEVADQADR